MARRVALQMDPVASLNPRGDSTLLLGREAQRRGYELFCYAPRQLSCEQGRLTASAQRLTLHDDPEHFFDLHEELTLDLAGVDVVLLRQDPPFDMAYVTTTYLLEMLPASTRVVNRPGSVRDLPEKLFPLLLRDSMPPTLISSDSAAIAAFREEHKDLVVKPLYGYGGRSIIRIKPGDNNLDALLEMHLASSKEPLMIQKFLPEVKTGDRRVILIDGEVGGVMGRIPAEHEFRANFRVGGSPAKAELTPRQRDICAAMGPILKEKGLIFAGADFIGDWLTEVNLTSPTGLVQMNRLYGLALEAGIWDAIEATLP